MSFQCRRRGKLPRKRKKACIKTDGRMSYYVTIKLALVTGEYPVKFWVKSKVVNAFNQEAGIPIPTPTEFW